MEHGADTDEDMDQDHRPPVSTSVELQVPDLELNQNTVQIQQYPASHFTVNTMDKLFCDCAAGKQFIYLVGLSV